MKCPKHQGEDLFPQATSYGTRWSCPVEGCTVVKWGSSTSTPADFETRQARIQAHGHFDRLWQTGQLKRQRAYKKLAHYLGLPIKKTHIGHFSKTQCERTIEFCKQFTVDKGGT